MQNGSLQYKSYVIRYTFRYIFYICMMLFKTFNLGMLFNAFVNRPVCTLDQKYTNLIRVSNRVEPLNAQDAFDFINQHTIRLQLSW